MSQFITDAANNAVKQLAKIIAHTPQFEKVTLEVQVEGDDLAIINFNGEDVFIEVHVGERRTIAKSIPVPVYVPGYYKHHHGDYFNPPEVEDVPLDECNTPLEAMATLVSLDYMWRMENMLEAESYMEENAA